MSQLQPSQAGEDDDVDEPDAAVPAGGINLNIKVAQENKLDECILSRILKWIGVFFQQENPSAI